MAAIHDIKIDQGASFKLTVGFNPERNLAGFSGRGSIKLRYEDVTPLAEFTVAIVDEATGVVSISLDPTALSSLAFKANKPDDYCKAVYDVELFTAGNTEVIRLINGVAFISPEVTK